MNLDDSIKKCKEYKLGDKNHRDYLGKEISNYVNEELQVNSGLSWNKLGNAFSVSSTTARKLVIEYRNIKDSLKEKPKKKYSNPTKQKKLQGFGGGLRRVYQTATGIAILGTALFASQFLNLGCGVNSSEKEKTYQKEIPPATYTSREKFSTEKVKESAPIYVEEEKLEKPVIQRFYFKDLNSEEKKLVKKISRKYGLSGIYELFRFGSRKDAKGIKKFQEEKKEKSPRVTWKDIDGDGLYDRFDLEKIVIEPSEKINLETAVQEKRTPTKVPKDNLKKTSQVSGPRSFNYTEEEYEKEISQMPEIPEVMNKKSILKEDPREYDSKNKKKSAGRRNVFREKLFELTGFEYLKNSKSDDYIGRAYAKIKASKLGGAKLTLVNDLELAIYENFEDLYEIKEGTNPSNEKNQENKGKKEPSVIPKEKSPSGESHKKNSDLEKKLEIFEDTKKIIEGEKIPSLNEEKKPPYDSGVKMTRKGNYSPNKILDEKGYSNFEKSKIDLQTYEPKIIIATPISEEESIKKGAMSSGLTGFIDTRLSELYGFVKTKYDRELKQNPDLSGKIYLKMMISPDGKIRVISNDFSQIDDFLKERLESTIIKEDLRPETETEIERTFIFSPQIY